MRLRPPPPLVHRVLGPAAPNEEEILGGVFSGGQPISTAGGDSIRLTALSSGACIFKADQPSLCRTSGLSTVMPVMPGGSRPAATTIMWGWYDTMDDGPCIANPTTRVEQHDLNQNNLIDDGGGHRAGGQRADRQLPVPAPVRRQALQER